MGLISRRDAGKLLIAGSAGLWAASRNGWSAAYIDSVIRGVQIGAQSYSFRDRDLDACIEAFKTVGLGECELFDGHVAPKLKGEELRKWWLSAPPSHFHEIRTKFDNAGVKTLCFHLCLSQRDDGPGDRARFPGGAGAGRQIHHIFIQCQCCAPR